LPKLLECRAHTLPVSRAPLYSDRSAHLFDRRSSLTVPSPNCRRPHARRLTYQNALLPERPTVRTLLRAGGECGRLPSLPGESATPCRTVMATTPCPGVPPSGCAEKRGCDRLGVFGKETAFYIFVALVFSGCSSWLGVRQELCLGQLRLCYTVSFLIQVKRALPGWATRIFILCVLLLGGAFFLFPARCEWCRQGLMKAK
jgi:hypothetical protein